MLLKTTPEVLVKISTAIKLMVKKKLFYDVNMVPIQSRSFLNKHFDDYNYVIDSRYSLILK
jgi:hypothetical protein